MIERPSYSWAHPPRAVARRRRVIARGFDLVAAALLLAAIGVLARAAWLTAYAGCGAC